MEERNFLKYTLTTLPITKVFQRIRFQIRVPENLYAITGIVATVSLAELAVKKGIDPGHCAGSLSLALPDKGDVVFNDEVRLGHHDFLDFFEKIVQANPAPNFFWFSATRYSYFDTFYKIKDALIEGYYESYFRPLAVPEPGRTFYKLNIYIRYITKEPQP